jgi:hypothetical protein
MSSGDEPIAGGGSPRRQTAGRHQHKKSGDWLNGKQNNAWKKKLYAEKIDTLQPRRKTQ